MQNNILQNAPLISAFSGTVLAQFVKPFIYAIVEKKFNYKLWFSTGSMPSSHTAATIALATSVALTSGVGSVAFAICIVLAAIVMNDAMGVRRAAGKQAEVINEWSKFFSEMFTADSFSPEHLKTMLGHSFNQVFWGFLLGIATGLGVTFLIG